MEKFDIRSSELNLCYWIYFTQSLSPNNIFLLYICTVEESGNTVHLC